MILIYLLFLCIANDLMSLENMQFEINSSINLIPKADWECLNNHHFPFTGYALLSIIFSAA